MDAQIILAFLVGILVLYVAVKFLMLPVKILSKLVINAILGGVLLIILNAFGIWIGIYIPVNIITAVIAGFLGIPGVFLLLILQNWFL